jgi:hypothetical protein
VNPMRFEYEVNFKAPVSPPVESVSIHLSPQDVALLCGIFMNAHPELRNDLTTMTGMFSKINSEVNG